MATPFTVYTGSDNAALTNALLASGSGITVSSIVLKKSGDSAVNFYDGTLAPLGIGTGLLLTSGTTPGTTNTVGWFGQDNSIWPTTFYNGDADIDAVVNTVFQTQSYDATTLEFDFTVADSTATSVSFDLVFASDEFPEWVDQFVDSAIVMVNGVNYALFNHDPLHPLSVVSANLAAGYFQDNAGNAFPIEYDGVSHVLKIVAPIIAGGATNHIKIGIADTGDHIYDSGIFIANLSAGNIPGSGVVIAPPSGTDNSDNLTGTSKDEYFDLKGGDDICYAGAGDDIVVAGSGNDLVYGGSGADQMKGDSGNDSLDGGADADTAVYSGASTNYIVAAVGAGFTITDSNAGPTSEGEDTLTNVEFAKFSDGLFALGPGGLTPVADPGVPPANTPGSVVISGIGSAGNILTATVSDPDGVAGAVSYQWQISSDNGSTWSDISGAVSNTYTVLASDTGMDIHAIATYVDNGAHGEAPISASKTILNADSGDLVVTLMQLTAPVGTSIINPLTTLLQDAIELGVTPNTAALGIKAALGLPDAINLPTYDAYAVLLSNPSDVTALQVEKVAVQIAILTSLSDDDTGVNLTLKILDAAANNQTLDLANINDLSGILGIPAVIDPITGKYPQPLNEIYDRNKSMSDAIADGGDVSVIEKEWQDLLSIQDFINSTAIADLSIHVNQAPTGIATANLANGLEDTHYTINSIDLLQGFSDTDGGVLSVSGLSADNGSVADNGDGTFNFTPMLNFNGPVELAYTVIDGQGGSALANQLFVMLPSNDAPIGTATAVLASGTENVAYTVSASDLLAGFSDVDGDTLSVADLSASDGVVADNGDGTFTITPTPNFNGPVILGYNVIDGNGGSVGATQNYTLIATLSLEAGGNAILNEGDTFSRTIVFSDGADNGATGWSYSIDYGDGAIVNGAALVKNLDLNHLYTDGDANRTVMVTLTDEAGETASDSFQVTVNNVAPDLTASGSATGMAGQAYTLALSNLIDPGADALLPNGISVNWGD
ncbi:partial Mannuronan C5-epimerase AlgE1, partial [Burkholderiales bacterium]